MSDVLFEWDPEKAARNYEKHGVSFEEAAMVFTDPLNVSMEDRVHGEGERRWITMGLVGEKLILAVHAFPRDPDEGRIRIISARLATRAERVYYEGYGSGGRR